MVVTIPPLQPFQPLYRSWDLVLLLRENKEKKINEPANYLTS